MRYIWLILLSFPFITLQAQVKGMVKDNLGEPVAGANLFGWGRRRGLLPLPMELFPSQNLPVSICWWSVSLVLRTIRYM